MSRSRARISAVLKVRKIQEQQAAAEMARAQLAIREADFELAGLRRQYVAARELDQVSAPVPEAIDVRRVRMLQGGAIMRGRHAVEAAVAAADERRVVLSARTQAVKGLERLDERLSEDEQIELRRSDVRVQDEIATGKRREHTP